MNINDMLMKAHNNLMASSVGEGVKQSAVKAIQQLRVIRNDRLRVCAGRARCSINRLTKMVFNLNLEWNPHLFSRMTEDQQFNTVSHEYAHLVEYMHRLESDHGYFWQTLHRACGGTAERTHTYDTTGLKKNIKRIIIVDTITNREYKITMNNWNKICNCGRYKRLKTEVYQGHTLMASYTHA